MRCAKPIAARTTSSPRWHMNCAIRWHRSAMRQLLGIKGLDPAQAQTAREIISRQVARMALLLDDLLEVSRITRGRLELRVERVSLNAVVKAAVETSRPLIESKKHSFAINLPEKPLELQVDPLRMSQALSNLLTNAAKYNRSGRAHRGGHPPDGRRPGHVGQGFRHWRARRPRCPPYSRCSRRWTRRSIARKADSALDWRW